MKVLFQLNKFVSHRRHESSYRHALTHSTEMFLKIIKVMKVF